MATETAKLRDSLDRSWDRKWPFRRATRRLGLDPRFGTQLDALHARLVNTLEQHGDLLEGIRKNAIGPSRSRRQSADPVDQNVRIEEIEGLGWELVAWTSDVVACLTEVVGSFGAQSAEGNWPTSTSS